MKKLKNAWNLYPLFMILACFLFAVLALCGWLTALRHVPEVTLTHESGDPAALNDFPLMFTEDIGGNFTYEQTPGMEYTLENGNLTAQPVWRERNPFATNPVSPIKSELKQKPEGLLWHVLHLDSDGSASIQTDLNLPPEVFSTLMEDAYNGRSSFGQCLKDVQNGTYYLTLDIDPRSASMGIRGSCPIVRADDLAQVRDLVENDIRLDEVHGTLTEIGSIPLHGQAVCDLLAAEDSVFVLTATQTSFTLYRFSTNGGLMSSYTSDPIPAPEKSNVYRTYQMERAGDSLIVYSGGPEPMPSLAARFDLTGKLLGRYDSDSLLNWAFCNENGDRTALGFTAGKQLIMFDLTKDNGFAPAHTLPTESPQSYFTHFFQRGDRLLTVLDDSRDKMEIPEAVVQHSKSISLDDGCKLIITDLPSGQTVYEGRLNTLFGDDAKAAMIVSPLKRDAVIYHSRLLTDFRLKGDPL